MSALEKGTVLGERFEILGELGQGGMAVVYLARDRLRGESVALKVLHAPLTRRPSMRARMQREVQAASRLRHPGALLAHELHELDGQLCLSMPVHPGTTLAERVESEGPLSADALWALGARLSDVLAAAHRQGVLHRDVTPNNIMIDAAGEAALMDFGLARLDDLQSRSGTGALGTAGYAAPEVYDGVRSDPRSDLYGLGASLYFAATGQHPFEGGGAMGALKRQLEGDFTPLAAARPDLPAPLVANIEALLQRDPAARPNGAREAADLFTHRQQAAREEAPPPPAPEPAKKLVLRPRLPEGRWSLDLRERGAGRSRRRRQRRLRLRRGHPDLEVVLTDLWKKAQETVLSALDLPPPVSPEERLANAVAAAADLPPGALRTSEAMLARRFRLVQGVDRDTALELAEVARAAGFRARVLVSDRDVAGLPVGLRVIAVLFFMLSVMALGLGASALTAGVGLLLAGAVSFAVMVGVLFGVLMRTLRTAQRAIPVAYQGDLSAHLAPGFSVPAAPMPAPEAAPQAASQAEAPQAEPSPEDGLLRRVQGQLDALARAIEARAAALPALALRDLKDNLSALRARAQGLATEARRLRGELSQGDADAAALAAAKVEARLGRLDALASGGRAVDAAERAALERALQGHRDDQLLAEETEARLTRVTAALLEIGGAASHSRRVLAEEADPLRSSEHLMGRLRQEVHAASESLREVETDEARRRRAQRGVTQR